MMGASAPHRPLDPYAVLGVTSRATRSEIRSAYRALVKRHHPDAGGDVERIVALNAAWELLGDEERRRRYDGDRAGGAGAAAPRAGRGGTPATDDALLAWMRHVYTPIDRLLAQVIEAFPAQLRALAADPYDDRLMEAFCAFLARSQARMEKVETLYRSRLCPVSAQGFGLGLYHCLSQVQDALAELERYTLGYVDGYLHDGREMLREASRRRLLLQEERRRL